MPTDSEKTHWVFRVRVADRAGALTSIASAFSNRSVSIDTVVGHGGNFSPDHDGTIVVTFWCTPEEKDEIVRVVRRLTKVISLEEHPYDSENLRKSALIRTTRKLTPRDVAGRETFLTCERMGEAREAWSYFVAGSPSELDPILASLNEQGTLVDVVYSVVGL
jgi:acetolactate synthase small subunit